MFAALLRLSTQSDPPSPGSTAVVTRRWEREITLPFVPQVYSYLHLGGDLNFARASPDEVWHGASFRVEEVIYDTVAGRLVLTDYTATHPDTPADEAALIALLTGDGWSLVQTWDYRPAPPAPAVPAGGTKRPARKQTRGKKTPGA